MSRLLRDAGAVGAGYALGSVPFGLLLGRAVRGLDVRDVGSGSIGSTNVLRAAGPVAAGATFALDIGKGTAAVRVARSLHASPGGQIGAGLAAMVGHSWPAFAGFRGGKSVATGFGGLLALSPGAAACAAAGGMSALAATRFVSVASLAAAGTATFAAGISTARGGPRGVLVYTGLASTLIALRHTDNLRRLARGLEPRVSLSRAGP
jgi:acyl phosphate:glycerol-3-phosphate acyltransferase